ncbi:hypothetical protein GCM10009624_00820 [Gordonia sinesedis]
MARSDSTVEPGTADPSEFRLHVVAESIRLFSEHGYESTTVEQIAAAAGVSRRTLFRQFRSKEDMIFADHETLLAQVAERLAADDSAGEPRAGRSVADGSVVGADPWMAVCEAAEIVFTHFLATRDLAARRLRVVQKVPALRERELVTTYRYQRIFEEYLRRELPGESRVAIVAFSAAVTSAHNYLLRSMIRGDEDATLDRLRTELTRIRVARDAVDASAADRTVDRARAGGGRSVAVVTFGPGTSADEISRVVGESLRAHTAARENEKDET